MPPDSAGRLPGSKECVKDSKVAVLAGIATGAELANRQRAKNLDDTNCIQVASPIKCRGSQPRTRSRNLYEIRACHRVQIRGALSRDPPTLCKIARHGWQDGAKVRGGGIVAGDGSSELCQPVLKEAHPLIEA